MEAADARNLLALVCAQGFKSNTEKHVGCEKIVAQPPTLLDSPYEPVPLNRGEIGVGGIAYTKGWTRAVIGLFLADAIVRMDLLPEAPSKRSAILSQVECLSTHMWTNY